LKDYEIVPAPLGLFAISMNVPRSVVTNSQINELVQVKIKGLVFVDQKLSLIQ